MNAGVLVVAAGGVGAGSLDAGLTGFVFNVMLIVRAPLQLFQSIQTSILPHLAGLEAREDAAAFRRAIRATVLAIGGFGLTVALGLLAVGPPGDDARARRQGLSTTADGAWPPSAWAWACTWSPGPSTRPRWPAAAPPGPRRVLADLLPRCSSPSRSRGPSGRVGHAGRGRLCGRHSAAVGAAVAAVPPRARRPRRAPARRRAFRRRRRPRPAAVGRARVVGPEHGRAGHQQVGARRPRPRRRCRR